MAALLLVLSLAGAASAQQPSAAAANGSEPFRITDNSFLVEEAFNQEAGIFQNIFNVGAIGRDWAATFTQEWPVVSQKHQFSYTLAWVACDGDAAFGDTLINYRYQACWKGPDGRRSRRASA